MFKLPAILFAVFMGFLMSMTLTLLICFYLKGFSANFIEKWFELWQIAYPLAAISIIVYRPLVLRIVGSIIKKLNSPRLHR